MIPVGLSFWLQVHYSPLFFLILWLKGVFLCVYMYLRNTPKEIYAHEITSCQVSTSASWHRLNTVPSQDFCSSLKTCPSLLGSELLVNLREVYNRFFHPHPEGVMCTQLDVVHEENRSVRTC